MSNKKYFAAALAVGLAASVLTGPVAFANRAPAKAPQAIATHYSDLSGSVAVVEEDFTTTPGEVTGDLSLEVDQTGVNTSIVHANLDLPSGFTWVSADVSILDEAGVPVANQGIVSYSGGTLSVRGLTLVDLDDEDTAVEFTLLAENSVISTTVTTEGDFSVSSQYRTNPNRKFKEQTWVVSTADAISLSGEATCDLTFPSPKTLELPEGLDGEGFIDYYGVPFVDGAPLYLLEGYDFTCFSGAALSYYDPSAGDTDWTELTAGTPSYSFGEGATISIDFSSEAPIVLTITDGYTVEEFAAEEGLKFTLFYGTQTLEFIVGLEPA